MTNESGARFFGFDHSFILCNSSFVIPFHSLDIRHFALCHSFFAAPPNLGKDQMQLLRFKPECSSLRF
jgi:hypothetical protein